MGSVFPPSLSFWEEAAVLGDLVINEFDFKDAMYSVLPDNTKVQKEFSGKVQQQ